MNRAFGLLWRTVLLTAIGLVLVWFVYFQPKYVNASDLSPAFLRGNTSNEKNQSALLIRRGIDKNSIVLQGSSELSGLRDTVYHPSNLYNADDANVVMIGAGYYQSLLHAITLAGIETDMPNKKIAMIVSIQWFSETGSTGEQAASRFSKELYLRAMTNESLSTDLKKRMAERTKDLFRDNKDLSKWLVKAQRLAEGSIGKVEEMAFRMEQWNDRFSRIHELRKQNGKNENRNRRSASKAEFSWESLLEQADQDGRNACTNNPYFIENSYYDTYIKDRIEEFKGSNKYANYDWSPEYADLQLYLETAKELNMEVALFLIPPQGHWADYTEHPQASVDRFVAKIRELASKYDGVTIYDHTPYSHEPYYFKDIMHLGWKGWIYVQKDLRSFQTK